MTPPPPLHLFRDPPLDGPTNMARDEHMLYAADLGPAALRLYEWSPPTISLGYFQSFARLAEIAPELRELPVVRRQTGGGAILHDQEITYCLVLDQALPLARQSPATVYELAHRCWKSALASTGIQSELAPDSFPLPTPRTGPFFCFEKPGRTDLMVNGRKLLGSAQRRTKGCVLQHGSLLLEQRFPAHPGISVQETRTEVVQEWCSAFVAQISAALTLELAAAEWTPDRLLDVEQRRQKFASEAWTRKQP